MFSYAALHISETTGGNGLVTLRMHAVVLPYECNDVILVVTVCRKTSQYDVNFQRNLHGEKPRFFQSLIKYSIHMHMSNKKQVINIKVITILRVKVKCETKVARCQVNISGTEYYSSNKCPYI